MHLVNDGFGPASIYQIDFLQGDKTWTMNRYEPSPALSQVVSEMMGDFDAQKSPLVISHIRFKVFNLLGAQNTFTLLQSSDEIPPAAAAFLESWIEHVAVRVCYTDLTGALKGEGHLTRDGFASTTINNACPTPPVVISVSL